MQKIITLLSSSALVIGVWAVAFYGGAATGENENAIGDAPPAPQIIEEVIQVVKAPEVVETPTTQPAPTPEVVTPVPVITNEPVAEPAPAVEEVEAMEAVVETEAAPEPPVNKMVVETAPEPEEKPFMFETIRDITFEAVIKDSDQVPMGRTKVEWINPINDQIVAQGITTNTGMFKPQTVSLPIIVKEVKLKVIDPRSQQAYEQMVQIGDDTQVKVETSLVR